MTLLFHTIVLSYRDAYSATTLWYYSVAMPMVGPFSPPYSVTLLHHPQVLSYCNTLFYRPVVPHCGTILL
jgi:hypothetical protein